MREKIEALREERAALKDQICDLTAERDDLNRKLLEFVEKSKSASPAEAPGGTPQDSDSPAPAILS